MFGTRIVAGRGDADLLRTGRNDPLCPTDDRARNRLENDQAASYTPFEADVFVEQKMSLPEVAGIPGHIAVLPEHTEGSLVVVVGTMALVGDLFRGSIIGSSAKTHFYMCDLDDNRDDIRTVLDQIAPDAKLFFTGHFGPVERRKVVALVRDR